ncbi:hypothetical protein ACTMTJ_19520 [Phytohabitans sp. LJ34]|uniref:hypothetical protein n=1 Tax=Phytohabitans sp. LJ34 TaxID=3452217 RepID=UPI003F8C5669
MTRLTELVREDLSDLADSHPVPDGLAERAVAAGRRRRRRRTALVGAAAVAVAAAVVVPVAVRLGGDVAPGQAATGRNVIFAKKVATRPKAASEDPGWQVLDPRTGRYRTAAVGDVSEPSADRRYAAVLPPYLDTDQARIGRYETRTGEIRWYDAPAPSVDQPQISPDGRLAAYWVDKPTPGAAMTLVDFGSGKVTPIDAAAFAGLRAEIAYVEDPELGPSSAGRPRTTYLLYPPGDPIGWRLENDRLTVGAAILDLNGRRTGTLPLPEKAAPVSILPGGAGALVRPEGMLGVYALTDATGAVTHRVTLRICSHPETPHDRTRGSLCTDAVMRFHAWRTPDQILIKEVGYGPNGEWTNSLEALDLVTGERRAVYRDTGVPPIGGLVLISADGLPRKVQRELSF